jgi:hypothetical protein
MFMATFTIQTEGVNVEEIMKDIHRRVLEKKQAGVYTDDDLARLTELKNDLSPRKNERYSEMSLHLRKLHSNWDMAASGEVIKSHRKVLGPLMVLTKKIATKFLRFFGAPFFTRQTEFNSANVRFSSVVLEELTRLSEENRQLQKTQQELLRRIEQLTHEGKGQR